MTIFILKYKRATQQAMPQWIKMITKINSDKMKTVTKFLTCACIFFTVQFSAFGQNKYYPKGDPHKFQAEITVPMWLPWIKGQAGVDGLLKDVEGDISATPSDLLHNLKAAIMLNADVSKGGFVGFVNYMHIKLGSEKAQAQLPLGRTATWDVEIKNDILDIAAGGRVHFNKGMVDPFFGVRYFNLGSSVNVSDSASSKTGSRKVDFWDPMFGARLFYYPKERWLLFLRTDFGGIWGGSSKFSWNIEGKVGYTISPTVDIAAGFRSYSFEYAKYTSNNARIFYMKPHMYGFELSASFMIPKRNSNTTVFPKAK
jgi:hypothetical protein